ncbi:MAG: hypothetical protein QM778_31045 [Myxococcales bacterium]
MTKTWMVRSFAAGVFLFAGAACGGDKQAEAAPASTTPEAPAAANAADSKTKLLHCGDFFTAAEITALGLDASTFKPDEVQMSPGGPILCNFAGYGFTLFSGDNYSSIVGGSKEAIAKGKITAATGPTIGKSSEWTISSGLSTCLMLSTNGRFAGVVDAGDQATTEKFARALDANISKMP